MNNRRKGLGYVHEVKNILQRKGYHAEGPMFRPLFIGGKRSVVHADFFGLFDLITYDKKHGFEFHQVSVDAERSRKIKKILELQIPGYVWGRCLEGGKVLYKIYKVSFNESLGNEIKLINAIYLSDYGGGKSAA